MLSPAFLQISKIIVAASAITLSSRLAGARPGLAGFIIALPLSSLLALAFSQAEHQDPQKSMEFARSIFLAVPLSLTFFIPFFAAPRLQLGFWGAYASGLVLLAGSYFIHRAVTGGP